MRSRQRWIAFLVAAFMLLAIHECLHVLTAAAYGEFDSVRVLPIGIEIVYGTPVEFRAGARWAFIAGLSNLVTLLMGYLLLANGVGLSRAANVWVRNTAFYLTLIALIMDPFNLSCGSMLYGGDAPGIAVGLGVPLAVVQLIALMVLLLNRELIAVLLFPIYGVTSSHVLFRPLFLRRMAHNYPRA